MEKVLTFDQVEAWLRQGGYEDAANMMIAKRELRAWKLSRAKRERANIENVQES